MSCISNRNREYYVKNIRHEIPPNCYFKDPNTEYKYDKTVLDKLYHLLKHVIKILDRYIPNKYCAISGTLLGAIRHKGFIPWDDDIDILMMKKDFLILTDKINELNESNKNFKWIYSKFYGSIKVIYKNYCLDLLGVDFIEKNVISYYAPCIKGKNSFFTSKYVYPYEKYNYDDIFPVSKYPFEDFQINCPKNSKKVLIANYSNTVLEELVLPSNLHKSLHATNQENVVLLDFLYTLCEINPKILKNVRFIFIVTSIITNYKYLSKDNLNEYVKAILSI